jgi:hypothetical protein
MLLRDHPLISYRGIPTWPPAWTWIDGGEDKHPRGEVGILRTTLLSRIQPANRCYLLICYEGASYMGCLLFDDYALCDQVTKLLQRLQPSHCGNWEHRSRAYFVKLALARVKPAYIKRQP